MSSSTKKMTLVAFMLMLITSVFGVTNIGIGFYRMGYAAIPMFIIGAVCFFIPFIFMMIEFGTAYNGREGGIYLWMKENVNPRFALYGVFMWYASYVVWMMNKALNLWTPFSVGFFGEDKTASDDPTVSLIIGVLAILLVIGVTFLITKGASKFSKIAAVGGIAVLGLTGLLIIGGLLVLISNGFQLVEPLTMQSLVVSPNADYQSILPFLGFMVFALFAFGGVEAMAGIAEDLENPERDLKKGIYLSSLFITVGYIVGFLAVGAIMSWAMFPEGGVNSLNTLYIIIENLGIALGEMIGMSDPAALGNLLYRISGISMFLAFIGAFITLSYAPLKQLISATPASYWPKSFSKPNKNGIYAGAIWCQAFIVIGLIATKVISGYLGGEGANALFDILLNMTNVAMTIPYLFLIFAWYKFRKNSNAPRGLSLIKSEKMVLVCTIVTMSLVGFGNFFYILDPIVQGAYSVAFWTVIGPIIFCLGATFIYNRGSKKESALEE